MSRYYALNLDGTLRRLTPHSHDGNVADMDKEQMNLLVKGLKAAFTGEQLGEMIDQMSDGWYPGRTLETAIGAAYLTSDEVPEPVQVTQPVDLGQPYVRPSVVTPTVAHERAIISTTLQRMLGMMDGWIEGARDNHDGEGHRGEMIGEECWVQWHPADFRRMINDVARELGVAEFPALDPAKEDEVR